MLWGGKKGKERIGEERKGKEREWKGKKKRKKIYIHLSFLINIGVLFKKLKHRNSESYSVIPPAQRYHC